MLNEVRLKVFPVDVVVEYYKKESTKNAIGTSQASSGELDQLLKFLRIEVGCRETTSLINNWPKSSEGNVPVYNRSPKKQTSTPAVSSLQNRTNSSLLSSFLCSATLHKSEDCPSGMTLTKKSKQLASDGQCFRCTANDHLVHEYRRRVQCQACKQRHASSMCDGRNMGIPSSTNGQKLNVAMLVVSSMNDDVRALFLHGGSHREPANVRQRECCFQTEARSCRRYGTLPQCLLKSERTETTYSSGRLYDVVMEYDDAANSTLALLEHYIDVLQIGAPPPSSVPHLCSGRCVFRDSTQRTPTSST